MRFLDEAKIFVRSGNGGRGAVSFRREKYIEFGGPNGGDGGRGGHVIACVDRSLNTLVDFRYRQHFKAKNGGGGSGDNKTGAAADDVRIALPLGTQILSEDRELLFADMADYDKSVILANGGDGGRGNVAFKSSTNRAPRQFDSGGEGEEMWLWLRLKLLADVGLVGLPNAGKSTFLSVVSAAKPKIANYPFTTLTPKLGVVSIDDSSFVMADIPGLIKGAHSGIGLGVRFLGHIERCKILLHLLDATAADVLSDFFVVREELSLYEKDLSSRPFFIVLTKCDAISESHQAGLLSALQVATNMAQIYCVSAHSGKGLKEILRTVRVFIDGQRDGNRD